jgi:NAD(P)-dependent dehydrogenase (short-subunit alcohol dehydrogenase family)
MSGKEAGGDQRSDFPEGVAIVIGGSGGIGAAICAGLARAGTDVVLTYRGNERGAAAAAEAVRAAGQRVDVRRLSVSDPAAVTSFIAAVAADHGNIHTVVNAAGADIPIRFIAEVSHEEWREVIESDLHGFFNVVRASLPYLREGGGSYVVVSSVGLRRWPARDVLSVAPKAAIEALVRGIASEEGRFGIRANSVALGVIETGIFLRLRGKDLDGAWLEAARNNTALKRFGRAEEVADAVVYLASSRASYVTGQMLAMDGGYSI